MLIGSRVGAPFYNRKEVGVLVWNVGSALVGVALLLFIFRGHIFRAHDRKFAGVPLGGIPLHYAKAKTISARESDVARIRDTPPELALADAGILLTGATSEAHVSATIINLAAKGAIRLRGGDSARVEIVDPDLAEDSYEKIVMATLVESSSLAPAGYTIAPWSMTGLKEAITDEADRRAQVEGWFLRRPSQRAPLSALEIIGMNLLALAAIAIIVGIVGSLVSPDFRYEVLTGLQWAYARLWPLFVLLIIYLALYAFGLMPKQLGLQRAAIGRALTDQVGGFLTYLTTPEANRLNHRDGENTLTRYLPWAIIADEADLWISSCISASSEEAVALELARLYSDVAPPLGSPAEAIAALLDVGEYTTINVTVPVEIAE